MKILFILKRREDYNPIKHSPLGLSTGLFNSASFMVDMLNERGVAAEIEVALDNNCIDRLVTQHKPTHVIIEALWVVPSKFAILTQLHPSVKWIVRLHSEMPFMAGEGMAMDWIAEYASFPQISIGINAPRMMDEITHYIGVRNGWTDRQAAAKTVYLPNFYPLHMKSKPMDRDKYWVDVACFGAVRPLKNHLVQAHAALMFAKHQRKQLRFHVNGGRIEMKGDAVMHNLRGMFQQLANSGHQLIIHEWRPRKEFLELCAKMDMGLQCNFSETFNIVSADLISQGVPVVGSYEIPWSHWLFNARPAESREIAAVMSRTYHLSQLNLRLNQGRLVKYCQQTAKTWLRYFKDERDEAQG
jgi:hypothetical protein